MSELSSSKPIMESEISTSSSDMNVSVPQIDESSMEFNRANIDSLSKFIRLVDVDASTGLDLYCYIHCEPHDSEIRKQCRGVVFNKDKLIMKGFPYTIEYTQSENLPDINDNIVNSFDKCSFYDSYEGSLIRMFYFADKWYLSTNRKLDAFRSKWASKESFGSFFKKALEYEFENNERLKSNVDFTPGKDDAIERFQSVLDTNKQYMFLLLNNNENRIVCSAPENPTIFHVGTFVDFELKMNEDVYIPYPKKHNFKDIDELFDYVNSIDYKYLQGIIAFTPGNYQYKIFNQEYHDLYKARGNEPSIKFRYLQVRMNKKYNEILHYLYPEYKKSFTDYENYIYDIARDITKSYVERFIKKNYVTVPVEEFQVIRECHTWHLLDRLENKININKVIDILNTQPPTNINRMIRKRIMEKNTNGGTSEPNKPKTREHVSLLRNKSFTVEK